MTNVDVAGDVVPMRSRTPEIAAVALLLVTLAAWMAALVTAKPSAKPNIVVLGEPLLPPGTPRALRVSAVMPNATHKSVVTGVVSAGVRDRTGLVRDRTKEVPVVDGAARLPAGDSDVTELDLVVDGAIAVQAEAKQVPTHLRLGPPRLRFDSWSAEVQFAGPPAPGHERSRAPIYPVDGEASGRLKSRALILDENDAPTAFDLDPAITGARVDDGRVLRVDRSGLRIEVPFEADAGAPIEVRVESGEKKEVGLDLMVDGVVHDVKNVVVDGTATVPMLVGDARPGDVIVVHAGGVWPDELGRSAIARVRDPNQPLAQWIDDVIRRAGALPSEPLVHWFDAHPDDTVAARALLQRLHPAKLRAPKLELSIATERESGRALGFVYAALAALCVVVVAGLGLVRARGRRLVALVGALALALILGGLGGVLVVMAHG